MAKRTKRKMEEEGRKASVPLYVMLEPAQMSRYKRLADVLGLSMREVVTMAMEDLDRRTLHPERREGTAAEFAQRMRAELEEAKRDMDALVAVPPTEEELSYWNKPSATKEEGRRRAQAMIDRAKAVHAGTVVETLQRSVLEQARRLATLETKVDRLVELAQEQHGESYYRKGLRG